MHSPHPRDRADEPAFELDMTPMIDVTFLLISFFMVVGVIAQSEVEALYLPPLDVQVDDQPDPDRFILNVLRDGQMVYRGESCDTARLTRYLEHEAAQSRRGGGRASERKILVRADQDALYDFVQRLMVECSERGLLKMQFAVQQPREEN